MFIKIDRMYILWWIQAGMRSLNPNRDNNGIKLYKPMATQYSGQQKLSSECLMQIPFKAKTLVSNIRANNWIQILGEQGVMVSITYP